MKLLIVSHTCATAANQRLYAELEALTGWTLRLVIPARWKDEFGNHLDESPPPALTGRVSKVPVGLNGNIIFHFYRKSWRRYLAREKFDAIYVNHEPYALATAQICLANTARVPFGFSSCQNIKKNYPFPISSLERMVYRRSAFALPITSAVEETLRAKGYAGASTVCALPVDPERYRPRGEETDQQLIPRHEGEIVLGFVGRFVEAKGLRTLAQALCQLGDLRWRMVLIGTGPLQAAMVDILRDRNLDNRLHFTGYIPHDETPRYLSAMDLLILPSETQPNWKEQFGRVITESLACGTPVLGSDSGEIPVLIRASGGGLVFPEKNPEELAASLRNLIQDPGLRNSCAERGRTWTQKNISLAAVAKRMATTIENAVNSTFHATSNS